MRKTKGSIVCFIVLALLFVNNQFVSAESSASLSDASDLELLIATKIVERADAEKEATTFMTRAEFVMTITRLSGLDEVAVALFQKKYFYDVGPEYYETGYINGAVAAGLMEEVKSGYFEPEKSITYNQVIKSLVNLLGYGSIAKIRGGDDNSYYTIAIEKGLMNGINTHGDGYITRGDIYEAILNSLNVDILTPSSYGENIKYIAQTKQTILSYYHNISKGKGVVEANQYTALNDKNGRAGNNQIIIEGIKYNIENIQGNNLLGYNVEFYYYDKSQENNIIYIKRLKNNNREITVIGRDITDCSKMQYTYFEDNKEKKVKFANAYVIYNGMAFDGDDIELVPDCGEVTLIDNNKDSVYDVLFINSYKDYVVKSIDIENEYIYGYYRNNLDLSDIKFVNITSYESNKQMEFSEIKAGSVLSVSTTQDNELINIKISNKRFFGTITELLNDERQKVLIGENEYLLSQSFTEAILNKKINDIELGVKVEYFLNIYDEISYFEESGGKAIDLYEYGVLTKAGVGKALSSMLQVRIFTALGQFETFDVVDKAYIDEERQINKNEMYKKLCQDGELGIFNNEVVPQMIRFKVNENGNITHIDRVGEQNNSKSGLRCSYNSMVSGNLIFDAGHYAFGKDSYNAISKINIDAPVFMVPMENGKIVVDKENLFNITDVGYFVAQTSYNMITYKSKNSIAEDAILLAATLVNGEIPKVIPEMSKLNIFIKSVKVLNADGEITTKIYYSYDGVERQALLDPSINLNNLIIRNNESYAIKKGDAFRFDVDVKGNIFIIEAVYDLANNRIVGSDYDNSKTVDNIWFPNQKMKMHVCNVEKIENNIVRFVYNNPADFDMNNDAYFIADINRIFTNIVLVYNKTTNEVRKGTRKDLLDYLNAGDKYSKVLYCGSWRDSYCTIIYEN